jgi:hypothetical protein
MTKPTVTAVGRMLKPKGDEPQVLHRIAVAPDGTVRTLVRKPLK